MKAALMTALAILATPLAAAAQSGPSLVEELIVNARTPGPAWWSVSKGEAKVWVLGMPGAGFKENDRWDTKVFERRLGKGGRLIHADTSPRARLAYEDMTTSRRWVRDMKADDLERFISAMKITNADPAITLGLTPNTAAFQMSAVVFPPRYSPKLRLLMRAKVLDARTAPVGEDLGGALSASMKAAPVGDVTCLNSVTRMITGQEAVRAQAEAWMRGDVRDLVQAKMAYDPCQDALPKFNAARLRQDDALAAAIAQTLDVGQNAVALVDLVPLLRQQGVLDQLRSRGYVVRNPAQLDED